MSWLCKWYFTFLSHSSLISKMEISCLLSKIMRTNEINGTKFQLYSSLSKLDNHWKFHGGPVVRTRHFHCWGWGSIPFQGTKIPQAVRCSQNKYNNKKLDNHHVIWWYTYWICFFLFFFTSYFLNMYFIFFIVSIINDDLKSNKCTLKLFLTQWYRCLWNLTISFLSKGRSHAVHILWNHQWPAVLLWARPWLLSEQWGLYSKLQVCVWPPGGLLRMCGKCHWPMNMVLAQVPRLHAGGPSLWGAAGQGRSCYS